MLFEKNTYTLVFHNHDHSVYLPYGIIVLRSSCYMPWGRRPPGSVEWFVWALGGLKALNFFYGGWTNSADFTDFTLQAIFFDLAFDTLCTPFTHEIIAIYVHHVHDRLIPAYKRYMWHAHTHTLFMMRITRIIHSIPVRGNIVSIFRISQRGLFH